MLLSFFFSYQKSKPRLNKSIFSKTIYKSLLWNLRDFIGQRLSEVEKYAVMVVEFVTARYAVTVKLFWICNFKRIWECARIFFVLIVLNHNKALRIRQWIQYSPSVHNPCVLFIMWVLCVFHILLIFEFVLLKVLVHVLNNIVLYWII